MSTTTGLRSVALLEHAVDYTATALLAVTGDHLDRPTPCRRWTLRDLLEHMEDALAAFTEAGALGDVDLRAVPAEPEDARLVQSLRSRACGLLTAWHSLDEGPVVVGAGSIERGLLAGVGALEITVHGWDVAAACGLEHPVPPVLAQTLLEVALDVVGHADRGRRFAAARPPESDDPGERLLAFLGR